MVEAETQFGLQRLPLYLEFQARADRVKNEFVSFLIKQKCDGRSVAGYGAAAKGNTLLNYAGVKPDLLPFVCDNAPSKQGKFLPGSHIPILPPAAIRERRPDVLIILPWNIADELAEAQREIRQWNGRFAVAVPTLRMF